MSQLLKQCRWPDLPQPYNGALRLAVEHILSRFAPLGIIVAGSIVRGNPNPNSDFDICVVHEPLQRQRIQKFFGGIPTEIFVNPPVQIRRYFEEEKSSGGPSTAHMYATGFVILDRSPVVEELRKEAAEWLQKKPEQSELALTMKRYFNADGFENALDIADSDPAMASLLMHRAIYGMITYRFLAANQNLPRHKELLQRLEEADPEAGQFVRQFLMEQEWEQKVRLGKQAAERLNGATGFFEWETPLGDIEE